MKTSSSVLTPQDDKSFIQLTEVSTGFLNFKAPKLQLTTTLHLHVSNKEDKAKGKIVDIFFSPKIF